MAKKQKDTKTKVEATVAPNSQKKLKVAGPVASAASVKTKKPAAKKPTKKPTVQTVKKSNGKAEVDEKLTRAKQKSAEKLKNRKKKQLPTAPVEKEVNPKVTRPTDDEKIKIIERQNLVWELRKSRINYRLISERLTVMGYKASVGQVFEDYQYMLSLAQKDQKLTVEQYVEEECAILDDVQLAFYPTLKKPIEPIWGRQGKKDAADVVIACVKERAKLKNLYKPTEVKLNVDETLAALLELTAEELPDAEHSDSH